MADVEIYYEGSKIGETPHSLELPAGNVDVEFRKEGYLSTSITIPVEPDTRNDIEVPPMVALQ
jgi:hypothetical protein